jgi:hypothetical protein
VALVTLLLGGRGYSFDERAAGFLAEWIRHAFDYDLDDASGSDIRLAQRAGHLAELVEEEAVGDSPGEPYELGRDDVAVLAQALRDYLVAGDRGLEELHAAVQRFEANWDSGP